MDNNSDKYQKIQETLKNMKGHIHIINMPIPIEEQTKFFDALQKTTPLRSAEVLLNKALPHLYEQEYPQHLKRKILCQLSMLNDVRAFRALQDYALKPEHDLRYWAVLAKEQSQMNIEKYILDENQIFLSTGLGGKDGKLRFFIVFFSVKFESNFSDFQKKLIRKEIQFAFTQNNCKLEKYKSYDNFATIEALFPYILNIQKLLQSIISEINQYGDFLSTIPLITNVKKLNSKEILDFRRQQELKI